MDNYTMLLPNYTIGNDCYSKIGEFTKGFGTKAVIIGGKKVLAAAEGKIKEALRRTEITVTDTLWYGG